MYRERQNQLNLDQLIHLLKSVDPVTSDNDYKELQFDFPEAYPTSIASYRGSYEELALGFTKYQRFNTTLKELIHDLRQAVGRVYQGWKGGDFRMDSNTPLWVANCGHSSTTVISGVIEIPYAIIIETRHCEF